MRAPIVVAVGLAVCVMGSALAFAVIRMRAERAEAALARAEAAEGYEARVHAMEGLLERMAALEAEVARLKTEAASSVEAAPTKEESAEPVAAAEEPIVDESGKPVVKAPATKLDRWLDRQGMRGDLEQFVGKVYESSRNSRRQRERDEAAEQQKEREAMLQGPYGKHNFAVNSLTKKLDLDGRQQEFLYGLLTKYDERREAALGSLPAPDGENATKQSIEQHMKHLASMEQGLRQDFEADFMSGLSAKQKDAFEALPEHERGPGGGIKTIAFDAGGALIRAVGGATVDRMELKIDGLAPKPAPPQPAAPGGK